LKDAEHGAIVVAGLLQNIRVAGQLRQMVADAHHLLGLIKLLLRGDIARYDEGHEFPACRLRIFHVAAPYAGVYILTFHSPRTTKNISIND
jgi:hypothetical protein